MKIIIDKNVLLSGSIYASIQELDSPIQHEFYEISARLLNNIEDEDRLGYITNKIMKGCRNLLEKAIKDTIKDSDEHPNIEEMDALYKVSAICNQKIEKRIMNCNHIQVNTDDYSEYQGEILTLYVDLRKKFRKISERERKMGKKRVEASSTYFKSSTFREIVESQVDPAFDTLKRKLEKNKIEFEDIEILSQTIYLNEEKFEDSEIFLSSCDQHFVKVRRAEESEYNDFIPKAIKDNFGIKCMWPDELSKQYLE